MCFYTAHYVWQHDLHYQFYEYAVGLLIYSFNRHQQSVERK
jgi:hypothetical protein